MTNKVKVPLSSLENCLDRIKIHTEEARILSKCCGIDTFHKLVGKIGLILEWGRQLRQIDLDHLGLEPEVIGAINGLIEYTATSLELETLQDCLNSINTKIPNALEFARQQLQNQYDTYREFDS